MLAFRNTAVSNHCRDGMYFTIEVSDTCNTAASSPPPSVLPVASPPPAYQPAVRSPPPPPIKKTPPPPPPVVCKTINIDFPKLYYSSGAVRRFNINCCDSVRVSWAAGSIGSTHGLQQLDASGAPLVWPGELNGVVVTQTNTTVSSTAVLLAKTDSMTMPKL